MYYVYYWPNTMKRFKTSVQKRTDYQHGKTIRPMWIFCVEILANGGLMMMANEDDWWWSLILAIDDFCLLILMVMFVGNVLERFLSVDLKVYASN